MKRALLGLLLVGLIVFAIVVGAWLAPWLVQNPGLVMIEIGSWRLQMSVLVLVGVILIVWLGISLLVGFFRMPAKATQKMKQSSHRKHLNQGLLALSEGDWVGAEKALAKAMRSQSSTAGYLAAARAAQGQSALARRDQYLALADKPFGKEHFATALARARLLMGEGEPEQAIVLLEQLHLKKKRHQGVLKLLLQAYQQCNRWHEVRLLIPATRKAGIVDADRASELSLLATARELSAATDLASLEQIHRGLPRSIREQTEVAEAFASRALELDQAPAAEPVLRRALEKRLDDSLLALYAEADPVDLKPRIGHVQRWLQLEPESTALHLSLGRLFMQQRETDQARHHLEIAVRKHPDPAAYAALAQVLDRAGDLEAATQCYRNALRMEQGRAPEPLPLPTQDAIEPDGSK
ncbi:MAG: heme biosynthesis HemY N-terminal domain-containing protein [Pseudomonadota bacterium]